jgi:hypothetical protein
MFTVRCCPAKSVMTRRNNLQPLCMVCTIIGKGSLSLGQNILVDVNHCD